MGLRIRAQHWKMQKGFQTDKKRAGYYKETYVAAYSHSANVQGSMDCDSCGQILFTDGNTASAWEKNKKINLTGFCIQDETEFI